MKRPWRRVLGVGGLALTLAGFVQGFPRDTTTALAAWGKKKPQTAKPEPAPAATTAPLAAPEVGQGEVVHTFEDEAKLQEFKKLWEQRQAVILRMTVLKAYWDNEQTTRAKLNDLFAKEYNLDASKDYVLDTKRNVLLERKAPPEPPTSAAAPSTP